MVFWINSEIKVLEITGLEASYFLKNFAKFKREHLCWNPSLITLRTCSLQLQKRATSTVFYFSKCYESFKIYFNRKFGKDHFCSACGMPCRQLNDFVLCKVLKKITFNPLSSNPTKWLNILKQFVSNLPMNCLNVFDHFMGLTLNS